MRAAVVGAGLAGLAAACELQAAGAEVVVLEARERVGGRVWSRTLANGAVVEMGAEYILPGNSAIRELVERHGLGLWDKGMRYGNREPRGGLGTDAGALAAAMREVERALPSAPAGQSARAFLDGLEIDPGAREALIARTEISSANSADVVGARDLAGLAHVDDEPAPSIAGGNGRLPQALAAGLGAAVRLRSPVERVAWTDHGVRLRAAGAELEADCAVVAVPASVLGRIAFDPPLPAPLAEALAGVRYGHAAKLFVPLADAAAPPSAVMSVPERYWCWTATGPGPGIQPVVSSFAGSPAALAALEVERGPEAWLALARAAAHRPRARAGWGAPLHLVGRPVGGRRLLHLSPARAGRAVRARRRPARVRRRARRRRVRRADGGRVRSGRRAARALVAPSGQAA